MLGAVGRSRKGREDRGTLLDARSGCTARISLGHASIQTTERYLGVKQDLGDAPCDHLGLTGPHD
jgi:hypothetical protein